MTDVYADGSRILYSYDEHDRLESKECIDSHNSPESTTSYTYTQYDEVASVTHAPVNGLTVTTAYQYDTLGRKTKETSTYGNDTSAVTEYVYDSKGRLSTLKYPSQTNGISGLVYEYDALGRPVRIKKYQTNDTVREYTYGPFDRIGYTRDYVIGTGSYLKTSYGYDDLGRIISKTVTKNGTDTIVESYEVTYDKLDRIIELTRVLNNSDDPIDETRYYEYDDHGRLSRSGVLNNYDEPDEDETIADLIQYTAYEYDAAGNRIQINDRSGETTFTYNGVNQLIYQDAPEKEVEYIYDLRGNQTEASDITDGVITRNDYTVEGQLVRVSEEDANGTTVIQQNAYDAEGTRVQKTEGNDVKRYYYAGSDMVATTENGNAVFTGIYDGGEIVGAYLGATPSYIIYCTDMQGSTSVLNDGSLDISGGYSYSDYGEVTAFDGTTSQNEICYTGAVYDSTTGEHYLRARYYDPEQGVFTTQDTLRGEATDSALWNSYAYCNGDPVNKADPSGHDAILLHTDYMTHYIGHMAVLIKKGNNWRYFSWQTQGYRTPYMCKKANTNKYTSVHKKKVQWDINDRFKRYKKKKGRKDYSNTAYRRYIYIKGSFKKSYSFMAGVKAGKTDFLTYDTDTCNCAWMALEVLSKGSISATQFKAIRDQQYEDGSPRRVIPYTALKKMRDAFNTTIKHIYP